jgi:beta-xylosidase
MAVLGEVGDFFRTQRLRLLARFARPQEGGSPVYNGDFPDPYVLRVGSTYYGYATQAGNVNVQLLRSSDLLAWEPRGDALPQLPSWAQPGWTWAPAPLPRGDRYALFYTVREPRSGRQAISVASAAQPEGPFVDNRSEPLIFQLDRGGSIDPSPFVDHDGTVYLLWKSDDNALNQPSSLWCQRLTPDGLTLTGSPTELLRQDREWERPLIEAPAMVLAGGTYYLFYSANWWESANYAIGYGVGAAPTGPFRKVTVAGPWLASGSEAAGPGGQEFFTDSSAVLHMAYHAWTPGTIGYAAGGARSLRISRVEFVGGRPRVA